jgi:hypothetical protein
MKDDLVPGWMNKLKTESELAEAEAESERQRRSDAALVVESDGPKFWQQLQEALAVAVQSLGVLKLTSSFTSSGGGIRISVSNP